jgi:hypothetical protein
MMFSIVSLSLNIGMGEKRELIANYEVFLKTAFLSCKLEITLRWEEEPDNAATAPDVI